MTRARQPLETRESADVTCRGQIRRLLLIRNDRIGDLVLTLPTFEAARRALPGARISALVNSYVAPLLRGNRHLDEVIPDGDDMSGWELGRRLKARDFDAAVAINTNTRNCLALWRARIPVRACWAYKLPGFALGTHRVYLHRSHPPVHEAEFALAFLRRLGLAANLADCCPRIETDPAARARAAARIREDLGTEGPLFGIAPGCGGSAFNWPLDRYAQLAARLAEVGRVMVTGAPFEKHLHQQMRARLPQDARARVAFYTDFGLMELAGALGEADVFTAPSTGPMHIAGAVGTPVVALFSAHPAHSPLKWAPFGARNVILVAPLEEGESPSIPDAMGEAYMARIPVDEVVAANRRLLGREGP